MHLQMRHIHYVVFGLKLFDYVGLVAGKNSFALFVFKHLQQRVEHFLNGALV